VTGPEAARRLLASTLLRRLASAWTAGQIFLTGGSLRDRLLRVPTRDLDLAVFGDARDAGECLARAVGGRCFPLGRAPLLTWRVAGGRYTVDLWTVPGDLEQDIFRRDFTINALFWRLPRGPLIDLVGGLDDLATGRVRVVRQENLIADPLRVLRGARLLATHPHLRLTAESERQLAAAAKRLRVVARERVVGELGIMLGGPGAKRALAAAVRTGALAALLPSWESFQHTSGVARIAGELAALGSARGAVSAGARQVAAAVVAAPDAGYPDAWDAVAAARALETVGWPPRGAQRAAQGAAFGEQLLSVLGRDWTAEQELAAGHPEQLAPGVAWAVARAASRGDDIRPAGVRLLRWGRRFARRPGLLSGEEISRLLALPPGPARAQAVLALRRARAGGRVRTRAEAERFLREGPFVDRQAP
jgi:poly(A) polymerase